MGQKLIALLSTLLLVALLLVGCASITLSDMSALRKGMSPDEVHFSLQAPPEHEFEQNAYDDAIWFVEVYRLSSGDYSSQYVLLYKNGELYYWGYPHEFQRSNNETVNRLGELMQPKLIELKEVPIY